MAQMVVPNVQGKDRAWHTAFYFLAEHVRSITAGTVNHKQLYALVGTDGRYVNHSNPTVRKRTAGALSRIIHSKRYSQDMQERYFQDVTAFRRAAVEICAQSRAAQGWSESVKAKYG